jgi:UDP-GlcNAc:undecaprenyl-phosphate GlcNAc-1-phosphate transferase
VTGTHTLLLSTFLGAAVLSAALTAMVRSAARRIGFVDRPGGHKAHERPVALGGGLAVMLAVTLPMLAAVLGATLWVDQPPLWLPTEIAIHLGGIVTKTPLALALMASALVLTGLGLWDDAWPLTPIVKLLVELIVAVVLVALFDLRLLSHLGPYLSSALSVLWILTLINAMNFMDNMDGLASGVTFIAATVFAIAAWQDGQVFVPVCCLLLAGAMLGFLPFNWNPAGIFLGDAGSLVVGFFLAVFTILTTFADPSRGQKPVGALAPLIVMAVPLYDAVSVVLLRLRAGTPIWAGDRRHFSHRLLRRGFSVRQAVLVIWLATLVTALPALALPTANWSMAIGIAVQTILVVLLVALLERTGPAS